MTEDEAQKSPPDVDPWGAQQMQFAMVDRIKQMSVLNIHRRVSQRLKAK
jgi:hypothetical protein